MVKWLCLITYLFLLANQFTVSELEEQLNSSSPTVAFDWDGNGDLDFDHEGEDDGESQSLGKLSLDIYSADYFLFQWDEAQREFSAFYKNIFDQNVLSEIEYPPRAA